MDKKPLIVVSICVVVFLVLGSLSNVVGYQTDNDENNSSTTEEHPETYYAKPINHNQAYSYEVLYEGV